MDSKTRKWKARKTWVDTYQKLGSVSQAAKRCGIPRSTLYRWIKRYEEHGNEGLHDIPQRPKHLAKLKITADLEQLILFIRTHYKFGPQRIYIHLIREYNIELSSSTIWRVLQKHNVKPLKRYKPPQKPTRYSRPIPGDRVQIDVMKVRHQCYQFTAIDDCTRMRVLRLYSNKKAESSVDFLYHVLENFPFPIQRIQTDWGTEFFAEVFQYELMEHFIKFRPIKPRSPHLNGKVERSQKTDKMEFYKTVNLDGDISSLNKLLNDWEDFYNHKRPHSSLRGKTPWEKYLELENQVPIQPEVNGWFWESKHQLVPRCSKYWQWQEEHKRYMKTFSD